MCIDEYDAIENAVWTLALNIPHAVHFSEGMQVRNFLRQQPETKDWTDHDFDNRYIPLLNEVIIRCTQKENTNEQS